MISFDVSMNSNTQKGNLIIKNLNLHHKEDIKKILLTSNNKKVPSSWRLSSERAGDSLMTEQIEGKQQQPKARKQEAEYAFLLTS